MGKSQKKFGKGRLDHYYRLAKEKVLHLCVKYAFGIVLVLMFYRDIVLVLLSRSYKLTKSTTTFSRNLK